MPDRDRSQILTYSLPRYRTATLMTQTPDDSMPALLRFRANWLHRVRQFFDQRDFLEVQTPLLSSDTVVDRYIEPLSVPVTLPGGNRQTWYLQTSPEFAMKRLLARGAQAIYQITPAFRSGERGNQHNIEFTMLEWYRVGDDYQAGMDLLDQFAIELLQRPPARRMTYAAVFKAFAGIDPFASGLSHETANELMAERVEPALRELDSVIVYDWPADQAALANIRTEGDVPVAERFELYVQGLELANGYHELTDAQELRKRNHQTNLLREQDGKRSLPAGSRLLAAMEQGLPPCCGVALGFDRLLMLAGGYDRICQVMPLYE